MSTAPEPLFVETYGDRLHKAMKVARVDAKQLAAAAGVSRESIASYLHDRTVPSMAYNRALAWALAERPEEAEAWARFLLYGARPDGPDEGERGSRGRSHPRKASSARRVAFAPVHTLADAA